MQPITNWLKVPGVMLYLGGSPEKGSAPLVTVQLNKPQVIVDPNKKTITIIETE